MSVAYKRGQSLGPEDLKIRVTDQSGTLFDPAVIAYSIFDYTTGVEVLIGDPGQVPASTGVGLFYANTVLPLDANIGEWVVRWNMKQVVNGPIIEVVQRFQVVSVEVATQVTADTNEQVMLTRLRSLLRDNNPDRNYRFRPPNTEKFLQSQTQTMGYIWEDSELMEFLLIGVDTVNMYPPAQSITLSDMPLPYRSCVLQAAAAAACKAVSLSWVADEFSISPEELIVVRDGESREFTVTLEGLFAAAHADFQEHVKAVVREYMEEDGWTAPYEALFTVGNSPNPLGKAFNDGHLKVRSVNPETGAVTWEKVDDVCRHTVVGKPIHKVSFGNGLSVTCTRDHSLFSPVDGAPGIAPVLVGALKKDDQVAVVHDSDYVYPEDVLAVERVVDELYMYDLSVPGNENFVMASGIVAHNTYSISGVSLDIDKSSKYQSMADSFDAGFDKMIEALKKTVKYFKGLQQPRYGIGISSALGPFSRTGIQSRSNYVSGMASWS